MDHVEELDPRLTPVAACERLLDLPDPVLLESAAVSGRLGRYSFLTADPFLRLRSRGRAIEEAGPAGVRRYRGDPFLALQAALAAWPRETIPGLPPFQGGAAGYLAYDLAHHLERLPAPPLDDLALPELCMGLYDWVIAWDHGARRVWLLCTGLPAPAGPERAQRARWRAARILAHLARPAAALPVHVTPVRDEDRGAGPGAEPGVPGDLAGAGVARLRPDRRGPPGAAATPVAPDPPLAVGCRTAGGIPRHAHGYPVPGLAGVQSTFRRGDYLDAVARTREYILAGDIFQANISQRLEAPWSEHPFALYRRLRQRNPTPFAAYLDGGGAAVVSASPERFLQVRGERVETRPIKGTAARGFTPMHDLAAEWALRESAKDRAENVMIVDLLRNDLSRVCADHTVEVPELCVVERYRGVHHLVSTVVGRLSPGRTAVDLLRAAFPGGSITGAPKVRAMEIIAELEPTRRSVYTGAIGYLGFDGAMDTSIVIRTFIVQGGTAYFQVGGGIVVDSDPVREYGETLTKAGGLLRALEA